MRDDDNEYRVENVAVREAFDLVSLAVFLAGLMLAGWALVHV